MHPHRAGGLWHRVVASPISFLNIADDSSNRHCRPSNEGVVDRGQSGAELGRSRACGCRRGARFAGRLCDQVKPILTRTCVSCHGAAKPRGGLRLDTAAAALEGGKSGPAVLPGNGDESPLIAAVRGDGVSERMPLKRPPLAEAEIKIIEALDRPGSQGNRRARQPGVAPAKVALGVHRHPTGRPCPEVSQPGWARNPIDRFILARLDRRRLVSVAGSRSAVAAPRSAST